MSIHWKSPIDEEADIVKKPFTTPMILLLLYNDSMLYLQYKDSLNGMLWMQKTCVQKVYEGFPILQ